MSDSFQFQMWNTVHAEDTFSVSVRSNFAVQHLRAATQGARNAYEVELANATADLGPWFDDMMLWVPMSVVMAGAALEAYANELIQDILDGSSLSLTTARKQLLTDLKKETAGNALDKYRRLALLSDIEPPTGTAAWQDARLLARFRNKIMHSRPAWDHEAIHDDDLVKGLKNRSVPVSHAYKSTSLFPYGFMTYGCAKWSVTSVLAFSERLSILLDVSDRFASPHLDFTLP